MSATAIHPSPRPASWRRALAEAVTDPVELLELVGLLGPRPDLLPAARRAAEDFPLRVPRSFVGRMRPGDPADPLLRQVLPLGDELVPVPGFGRDPLAEETAAPAPGLLHKYRDRVLLVTTGVCAINCRYCFRRHFPYAEHHPGWDGWGAAVDYVRAHPEVAEVILSGGDPLAASDERLGALARELATVPHLRRLRLHTRLPVMVPERVDEALLGWLAGTRLVPVVVLHANHAQEIDAAVAAAIGRLRAAGVTALNQAVLLAGVNDSVAALADLSEALFAAGAMPYYLHLLDRVAGAAHFEVDEERARRLVGELAAGLPGYLVPRLVREVPGAPAKVPVMPILPG